jgi:hypothetical protein
VQRNKAIAPLIYVAVAEFTWRSTMFNRVGIGLSLAMMAVTATSALAASKNRDRPDPAAAARQVPAGTAYGQAPIAAPPARTQPGDGAMMIQDRDYRESVVGVPWFSGR